MEAAGLGKPLEVKLLPIGYWIGASRMVSFERYRCATICLGHLLVDSHTWLPHSEQKVVRRLRPLGQITI